MIGTRPSLFWRIIWYLISPLFLLVRWFLSLSSIKLHLHFKIIFYISMKTFLEGGVVIKGKEFSAFPTNVQIWSYLMVFVPMLCIPGYAIYKLLVTPGKDFDEVLVHPLLRWSDHWSSLAFATSNQTGWTFTGIDSVTRHCCHRWRHDGSRNDREKRIAVMFPSCHSFASFINCCLVHPPFSPWTSTNKYLDVCVLKNRRTSSILYRQGDERTTVQARSKDHNFKTAGIFWSQGALLLSWRLFSSLLMLQCRCDGPRGRRKDRCFQLEIILLRSNCSIHVAAIRHHHECRILTVYSLCIDVMSLDDGWQEEFPHRWWMWQDENPNGFSSFSLRVHSILIRLAKRVVWSSCILLYALSFEQFAVFVQISDMKWNVF